MADGPEGVSAMGAQGLLTYRVEDRVVFQDLAITMYFPTGAGMSTGISLTTNGSKGSLTISGGR